MTLQFIFRELQQALQRIPRPREEFAIRIEQQGWIAVSHRGRRRYYPLTPEIGVLVSGDVRRGAFDGVGGKTSG